MIKIGFLGTGGSVATVRRDNTSFLLKRDNDLILVDCPGSVIQKIKRLHADPGNINSILITHIHPDHIYGLPSLVHSLMLSDLSIDLFGSEIAVSFCREFLDLFHLREKKIKCRINFTALEPGDTFKISRSIQCMAREVPHSLSSLAFHFYFEGEGKELLYSGDTPVYPPLFQGARGINLLIHDCSVPSRFFDKYPPLRKMHSNSLELGFLSQEAGVKSLIPCHFFEELDFSMSEITDELTKNYTGNLIIPEDFDIINF